MHKFVLVARAVACWIVARLRTVKDTDGVNGRPAALYGLGGIDSIPSDLGLKNIRARRRAIGEEHNNLLGTFATRSDALGDVLGQVHAIVGAGGTGRLDGIDRVLEALCALILAGRKAQHGLGVVVGVAVFAIGTITDLIALLARKLYDGNLMLLVCILNALVLLGNSVDKAVGSTLERIDTLGGGPFTAHGIVHRARGVQHQYDIERLGDQRGRIRRRGHRRKRGREVGLPVLDSLDRLVRPDSADVLGRDLTAVIAARPELPMVAGVVVGYFCCRRSVHSGAGPGVGLGQHGKCCSRQHQHYGQYHRQETPRALTHRVSLLAVSDLATA